VEDPHLQARHRGEADAAHEQQRDDGRRLAARDEREGGQHRGEGGEDDQQRPDQVTVGGATAPQVAGEQADAEEHQQPRHGTGREAAHLGERERDVGEAAEHAAVPEDGDGDREPDLGAAEGGQLGARARRTGCRGATGRGHEGGDADEREDADDGDRPEGRAPTGGLAEERAERDAEDVGQSEATEHECDGAGLAVGGDQLRGDDRADAEEGAVTQGRDDAAGHHHPVRRGDGGDQVAEDEQHHQAEQRGLARDPGEGEGQADGADRDAECVAGDEVAGGGLGDGEVVRDLGQQAHDHELGEADPEAADGEGEECDRHGSSWRQRRGVRR
jgi:hypothetical protein